MTHITTCPLCGDCYEESSEERANAPDRICSKCWSAQAQREGNRQKEKGEVMSMYAELMNENVRIRAENVMLRKVVFALIAQADKDPFMSIGHFVHGHASAALAEIRALNNEQERQMAQFIKEQMACS